MNLPPDIPPEAAAFLQEIGYLEPDRRTTGDCAPVLPLRRLDGAGVVTLGQPAPLPTVLIFGSYT